MNKNYIYKAAYKIIKESYLEWGGENRNDFAMFVEGVLCVSEELLNQFTDDKEDIRNADHTC